MNPSSDEPESQSGSEPQSGSESGLESESPDKTSSSTNPLTSIQGNGISSSNTPSIGSGNTDGSNNTETGTNLTQTLLITAGICVITLILVGLIANRFISHRKKAQELRKKNMTSDETLTAVVVGEEEKRSKKGGNKKTMPRDPAVTVRIDPKGNNGVHGPPSSASPIITTAAAAAVAATKSIGISLGGIIERTKSRSDSTSSPNVTSPTAALSPRRSNIIGGVGMAMGGGNYTNAGSYQLGPTGPQVGPGLVNPRDTFVPEVELHPAPQSFSISTATAAAATRFASALRTATPGYSQEHPHLHVPPELKLGKYPLDDDPPGLASARSHDLLSSPMYPAISPKSFGTMDDHLDIGYRHRLASPPLSGGSKGSMFLDPFRTLNSSQHSLGYSGDEDDTYPFPTDDGDAPRRPSPRPMDGSTTAIALTSSQDDFHAPVPMSGREFKAGPLPTRSFTTVHHPPVYHHGPPRSLDDLTEPNLVLRQIQSTAPAYYRNTNGGGSPSFPPTTLDRSATSNSASTMNDFTRENTRPGVERQAGVFTPAPDSNENRRSFAGSVVTPPSSNDNPVFVSSTAGVLNGFGSDSTTPPNSLGFDANSHSSSQSSVNEGNAWYRRRASVVIPDGGHSHVKLFSDDGETTTFPPCGIVINRSSRSNSVSSQADQTSPSAPVARSPSPLRSTRVNQDDDEESWSRARPRHRDAHDTLSTGRDKDNWVESAENLFRSSSRALSPSPSSSGRNGAAVFEGRRLQPSRSVSRSPSPRRSSALLTPQLVTEPEESEVKYDNDMEKSRSKEQEEEVDEVLVRLRPPRQGSSNSQRRRSYLDDYRGQQ